MRLWSVFRVTLREQLRSPWDLILVLALTPMLIGMYWSFMGGGSTSYRVLVLNEDGGECPISLGKSCADLAIEAMANLTYLGGTPILRISPVESRMEAEKLLRDRNASALVIFPTGFTDAIRKNIESGDPSEQRVVLVGDLGNPYYSVAAIMTNAAIDEFIQQTTNKVRPIQISEEPLGGSSTRSEFETYVPGLLIAAGTLMIFSVAISITRLIEAGTVRRLQLTRLTSFDLLGGISLFYIIISLVTTVLAYWTAIKLGFRSVGPLWLGILITIITAISVIGIGLITASFSGTTGRAAIVVNFPLIVLLFFSGAVFPLPTLKLFTVGGHTFGLADILPQTHAVIALNKVLSLGGGLSDDVTFEIIALVFLASLYFAIGIVLFRKMHMKTR
jgi:ABC-2 type transport system permease protein